MAPGLLSEQSESHHNGLKHDVVVSSKPLRQPIKASGVLDKFGWEDATPVIGREFPTLNIVDDIFNAENADELLRELAVTSMPTPYHKHREPPLLIDRRVQSLNEVSSSSASRTISPMNFRRNSSIGWASSPTSLQPPRSTSIPS